MSITTYSMEIPVEHMQKIFGRNDQFLKKLESGLEVSIVDRNGDIKITGEEARVKKCVNILSQLFEVSSRGSEIEEQ